MKYLLLIQMNPAAWEALSEEDRNTMILGHEAFQQPLRESGELVGFAALSEPSQSTTVKVRNDVTTVTDGPYAEAKEFMGGYYVVECANHERANEIAATMPEAKFMAIEVRPVEDSSGFVF